MSPLLTRPLRSLARHISRFVSAQDGGTEFIEFSIVILPFLATLIAILEICYFLFAQQTLQTAAVEAGRMFMTNKGPAQNQTTDGQGHLLGSSNICNIIQPLLDCTQVTMDVQTAQSYGGADTSMPAMYDGSGNPITSWNYNIGTPGQVVVIRLVYQLSIVKGPLGFVLSSLGNGKMEVMGVTAVRVEPS
jgi:Flp pilus assembly protein TadG